MDPPAGLPADVREALAAAPDDERALLELRLGWTRLGEAEARIAARLRVFLLTWDPLERVRDSGPGWATATGDGDSYEVVLYLPLAETLRRAEGGDEATAAVLGAFAASVLAVGAGYEQALVAGIYPQLAQVGEAPSLLSEVGSPPGSPAPELALAQGGWEPIGLGAIQDLVQEAFGPVELDRSPVRLDPAGAPAPGCPACTGQRFGFPAELEERWIAMCALHAERAAMISQERLARAQESNPEGWEAIAHASSLVAEPTFGLPLALLRRLDEVTARDPFAQPPPGALRGDAELALSLVEHLRGRPDDAAAFLGHLEPRVLGHKPRLILSGQRRFKSRKFCPACNSGWMNRIDQDARRLLQGFVLDARTSFDEWDQRLLSLWTTKTVLGLLSIEPPDYRFAEGSTPHPKPAEAPPTFSP